MLVTGDPALISLLLDEKPAFRHGGIPGLKSPRILGGENNTTSMFRER
jgi:hypothetical protein